MLNTTTSNEKPRTATAKPKLLKIHCRSQIEDVNFTATLPAIQQ